jgi:hypothetical protein
MKWTISEIKELLVEHGFSMTADVLKPDEQLLTHPMVWTKEDVDLAIRAHTGQEVDEEDLENIMDDLDIAILDDCGPGNTAIAEAVYNYFENKEEDE